jgi:hypothetical protein
MLYPTNTITASGFLTGILVFWRRPILWCVGLQVVRSGDSKTWVQVLEPRRYLVYNLYSTDKQHFLWISQVSGVLAAILDLWLAIGAWILCHIIHKTRLWNASKTFLYAPLGFEMAMKISVWWVIYSPPPMFNRRVKQTFSAVIACSRNIGL